MLNQFGLGSEGSGPTVYEILSDDSETHLERDRGLFSAYHHAQRFKVGITRCRICNLHAARVHTATVKKLQVVQLQSSFDIPF